MLVARNSKKYLSLDKSERVIYQESGNSFGERELDSKWMNLVPRYWIDSHVHAMKIITFFPGYLAQIENIEDDSNNLRAKSDEIFDVYLDGILIGRLPLQLCLLHSAIEKSKYILKLGDDWDDEGSVGYSKETWTRAVRFLITSSKELFRINSQVISAPNIYHGPDGSIDILWKTEGYRFLINIPVEPSQSASYYGDDYNLEKIQGTFDSRKSNIGILSILFQLVSNVADRNNSR